jgi:hypothetical protein
LPQRLQLHVRAGVRHRRKDLRQRLPAAGCILPNLERRSGNDWNQFLQLKDSLINIFTNRINWHSMAANFLSIVRIVGPHITRIDKNRVYFCPKFLELYASIYGMFSHMWTLLLWFKKNQIIMFKFSNL